MFNICKSSFKFDMKDDFHKLKSARAVRTHTHTHTHTHTRVTNQRINACLNGLFCVDFNLHDVCIVLYDIVVMSILSSGVDHYM